ncbi:hypothetical protein GCM10012287_49370 [Streptomyces daqingensis]|uniref:Uncharacterized protein n=1 Tax=Streptomyces daqingensis TaxID=1472640 RepID=A0ABQ2MUL0_9ACTN|nr:hypothetical protein [Streptomyces daqingensis]GGO56239.1 hypothetical protein GCM10012287_49370 [Streptomyces daqingensis]
MYDSHEAGSASDEIDPDSVLWVRGVDYVAGWRDARDAGTELLDAMQAAGMDTHGLTVQADAYADGGGMVRLSCSPALARELALLSRVKAFRFRRRVS